MLLTTNQVVGLTGVKYTTLHAWVARGIVRPVVSPTGRGRHRLFDFLDVFAVVAARTLRHIGVPLSAATDVHTLLRREFRTEQELRATFAAGRSYALIVGDRAAPILAFRSAADEALASLRDDPIIAVARANGLEPATVNLALVLAAVDSAIAKLAEPQPEGADA